MKHLLLAAALLCAGYQAEAQTISSLPSAISANLTDLLPCVQLGTPNVTRKCTTQQILTLGASTYLPLAGGALTGPTTQTISSPPSGNNGVYVYWPNNVAATTGTPTNAVIEGFADDSSANSTGGWWGVIGRANFDGTTNQGRPFIGVEGQAVLGSNASLGGPSSTPPIWGGISDVIDFTKAKSSLTNSITGHEIDLETNNVDDANQRQGLSIVIVDHAVETGGTGIPPQVFNGIHITGDAEGAPNRVGIKFPLSVNANIGVAGIDLRNALLNDGLSGSFPSIASPGTTGTTVPVTDVLPFTSDKLGLDLNNAGNGHSPAAVFINGNAYSETGYSITGNGPAGTITVTSAVGSDGTTGNPVRANSHTVWLGSFGDIAFDYAGTNGAANVRIFGDNANLNIIGGLKLQRMAYSALPACNSSNFGVMYDVYSAPSVAYNATLTGTGSAEVIAFCNGAGNWTSH